MTKAEQAKLSRREREIMEILYRLGEASAADVVGRMDPDPGYDSVRVTLGILEKKGHVKHRQEGRRYIYTPTVPHEMASRSAIRNVLHTFFRGSSSRAILALLGMSRLSREELDVIAKWIEEERKSHESDAG
ncbi:MAG: BlaI/MecI/CopY family transcriptional regulator [Gemmatimonadales bacterium]